ncbi:B12-binding domain-containing radical SAM protein [Streptomyces sp. NPDC060184]|uniref:B12-binding domain-containing radical SAM protein n=1 Tax=Streptomyces sp. NPDC060184 TaxID=3347064 RepID=UPI0036561784
MTKSNVYLAQVNNNFGDMAFLPYSVGMLQAYCMTQPDITEAFNFMPFVFLRENVQRVARQMDHPDVIGLSCYIWNWEYNRELARAVREMYPDCLIVMGGPQVPVNSTSFFQENPTVDILVHHEGEQAFAEILRARMTDGNYFDISGLSVRGEDRKSIQTAERGRVVDLDGLPSPYLNGIFDYLLTLPYRWSVSQETNRGCPYSCAFCDWGSAVFTKLRQFSTERLLAEIEWFGRAEIDTIYNCDANFGILGRDSELATNLASARKQYGYPAQFRTAYAKKSNETVFTIASTLHDAGLERGVTLSMQSMSDNTLLAINRRNIKQDNLGELIRRYREHQIPTYTEIILGLPGETAQSFRSGVGRLLELGQHEALLIYLCEVLPNSELGNAGYRESHGVRSVHMPLLLAYVTPNEDDVTEFVDVVVETAAMSVDEWRDSLVFSWFVQCFHCLNVTQSIAVFLNAYRGLPYEVFYEELIRFASTGDSTILRDIRREAQEIARGGVNGQAMGRIAPDFGDIVWNPEEAFFLRLIRSKTVVYSEIENFLAQLNANHGLDLSEELQSDLITFQLASLVAPSESADVVVNLGHRLTDFFAHAYRGETPSLKSENHDMVLTSGREYSGLENYALDAVRYGRKNNGLRRSTKA